MTFDEERIFEKIAYIQGQVSSIQGLLHESGREEIFFNQWLTRGLKYSIQTSVEAMVDIAYHISAKHGYGVRSTKHDAGGVRYGWSG